LQYAINNDGLVQLVIVDYKHMNQTYVMESIYHNVFFIGNDNPTKYIKDDECITLGYKVVRLTQKVFDEFIIYANKKQDLLETYKDLYDSSSAYRYSEQRNLINKEFVQQVLLNPHSSCDYDW
jgi:hypothetical protein